jgi:hypothetical protein
MCSDETNGHRKEEYKEGDDCCQDLMDEDSIDSSSMELSPEFVTGFDRFSPVETHDGVLILSAQASTDRLNLNYQ